AIDEATISAATFELRDSSNNLVPATVSYNPSMRTATLDPSDLLATQSSYTAILKGGGGGIKDISGNPLAADYTWSFTTNDSPFDCPCTIWDGTGTPAIANGNDGIPIELGVKFRSEVDGYITGLR